MAQGQDALSGNLKPGKPVATFLDRQGRQSNLYDAGGTGAPDNLTAHAGVFDHYIKDANGRITGMAMWEQYSGSHGPHLKAYGIGG